MFSSNNSQVANDAVFVEDVFSNFLYTGNGSTQTITNGIDLSGKGGMVWVKSRSNTSNHIIDDTVNGPNWQIYPNLTNNAGGNTNRITAFNSTGFNTYKTCSASESAVNSTSCCAVSYIRIYVLNTCTSCK